MKTVSLLFFLLVCQPVFSSPVPLTFMPPQPSPVFHGSQVLLLSDALNDTRLSGQTLSLDILWSNDLIGRFIVEQFTTSFSLSFFTDAPSYPGFAGEGWGVLLGVDYLPLSPPLPTVTIMSTNGNFSVGFEARDTPEKVDGFDTRGAHYEVTMPDTGWKVIQTRFMVSLHSGYNTAEWETAEQLPEPPSFLLLIMGLGVLAVWRWRWN